MTSASCSSRCARRVSRSSAPGPAPIRWTIPASGDCAACASSSAAASVHARRCRTDQRLEVTSPADPVRQQGHDPVAHAAGEPGHSADIGRQRRLDPGPHQPRQHRRFAFGRNRHRQRRTVDDRRGVEIAFVGSVDDVERDAAGPRRALGRLAVGAMIGDEHQRRSVKVGIGERPLVRRDRKCREVGDDTPRNNHDRCSSLNRQPRFIQGLFVTADDDDALTLDLVAQRKLC